MLKYDLKLTDTPFFAITLPNYTGPNYIGLVGQSHFLT